MIVWSCISRMVLSKDKENTKTRCTYCHKTIELSSSGLSLFNDHAKGKKHIAIVDKQKKSLNQNQNPQQKNPLNLVEKQLSQMSKHKKYWKCIFIFFSSCPFKSSCWKYEIHLEEEKKPVTEVEKKAMHIVADIDSWRWSKGSWKELWKWWIVNLLSALD